MAIIKFVPICSNCGAFITDDISYEEKEAQITPYRCEYCEEQFEAIKMPFGLPYRETEKEELFALTNRILTDYARTTYTPEKASEVLRHMLEKYKG